MVATIAAGTTAAYYAKQTEYYLATREPAGRWISRTGHFGVVNGSEVNRAVFERLHAGLDEDGRLLLSNTGDIKERVAGLDLTLSTPKSVSLLYAIGSPELRKQIEEAQLRAVKATIDFLDRHAAYGRRGKDGKRLERVSLTVASFQHGEARPAEHAGGKIFADPNLHTHCVILNLATRADGTVGALDGRFLFRWKMASGAAYHSSLAAELQSLGFNISEIGKNGVFEVNFETVPGGALKFMEACDYFSARRREVETAIAEKGLTTAQAPALAAAVALSSRSSKLEGEKSNRFELWAEEATRFGIDEQVIDRLRVARELDPIEREQVIAARITALPRQLTEHESVFEKRQLYAAVGAALVGTGGGAERIDAEVARLIGAARVVELGRDDLDQPLYSTPEMIALERDLVKLALQLSRRHQLSPDPKLMRSLCRAHLLNIEQTQAALAATAPVAVAIAEGAAGSGKTTMLGPIVEGYQRAGARVIGTAQAWRIAHQLGELGIEARATDSWIASAKAGGHFLDRNTVLLIDEAGLLSSRQMHAVLSEVVRTGAKALLLGDRRQGQAIGAGPGLEIIASIIDASRIDTIVRQRELWAREAVMELAKGRVAQGLQAFADRGLLAACDGPKAAVQSLVNAWEKARDGARANGTLLIAKTNAHVRAINEEVRARLRHQGRLKGTEIEIAAVTPSGHSQHLRLAKGDSIRFLMRKDDIGVINGTVAIVDGIKRGGDPGISVRIGKRRVTFRVSELADETGRARLTHAYASTVYGAQGLTTDQAFVLLDPSMTRHDVYVAASRSRNATLLCFDIQGVDSQIRSGLPLSQRRTANLEPNARFDWLAQRLSRVQVKTCTLDPALAALSQSRSLSRQKSWELDRG